jgi:hypothetical protein
VKKLLCAAILFLPAVAHADDQTASVHISANRPGVTLERRGEGDEWTAVCTAPCDKPMPAGEYRLGGTALRPTSPFDVRAGEPLKMRASMAPEGRLRTGIVLTIVGGVLLLAAGAFFAGAGAVVASRSDWISSQLGVAFFGTLGVVHAAPGLGLIVPGTILWACGSSSVESGEPAAKVGASGLVIRF